MTLAACPWCGHSLTGEFNRATRDERLQHAPMRELTHEELLEARRLGHVSEIMLRAEQKRRGS